MPRRGRGKGKGRSGGRSKKGGKGRSADSSRRGSSSSAAASTEFVVKDGAPVPAQVEEDVWIGLDIGSATIKVAVVTKSASDSSMSLIGKRGDEKKSGDITSDIKSDDWKKTVDRATLKRQLQRKRLGADPSDDSSSTISDGSCALADASTASIRIQQDESGHRLIAHSLTVLSVMSLDSRSSAISKRGKRKSKRTEESKSDEKHSDDTPKKQLTASRLETVIGNESLLQWPRRSKQSVCFVKDLLLTQSSLTPVPLDNRFKKWLKNVASVFGVKSTLRVEGDNITFEVDCTRPLAEDCGTDELEEPEIDKRRVPVVLALECVLSKLFQMLSTQLQSTKIHTVYCIPEHCSPQFQETVNATLNKCGFGVIQAMKDHCAATLSVIHGVESARRWSHIARQKAAIQVLATTSSALADESSSEPSPSPSLPMALPLTTPFLDQMPRIRVAVFDFGLSCSRCTVFDVVLLCKSKDDAFDESAKMKSAKSCGVDDYVFLPPTFCSRNEEIGGVEMDKVLLKCLMKEFSRKTRLPVDEFTAKGRLKLRNRIEAMKPKLCAALNGETAQKNVSFYVESLLEGLDLDCSFSAAKLDMLFYDLLRAATRWFKDCRKNLSAFVSATPKTLATESAHASVGVVDVAVVTGGGLATLSKVAKSIAKSFELAPESVLAAANGTLLANATGCGLQAQMAKRSLFDVNPLAFAEYCRDAAKDSTDTLTL